MCSAKHSDLYAGLNAWLDCGIQLGFRATFRCFLANHLLVCQLLPAWTNAPDASAYGSLQRRSLVGSHQQSWWLTKDSYPEAIRHSSFSDMVETK
jgi:hypothetical protein